MKIGVIGYANNTGLGNYIQNFRTHLPLDSQFVIRHPDKGTDTSKIDVPYSYGSIIAKEIELIEYLDTHKPDIVLLVETSFNDSFFELLHERNIRVVYVPMVDCRSINEIRPFVPYIDAIINHTNWGHSLYFEEFGEKAHYIPYPIDTDYFHPDKLHPPTFDFLHNQGTGGSGYRKATDQVFIAFRQLSYQKPSINMLIHSQPYEHIHSQLFQDTKNVNVCVHDYPNVIDIYKGGKVYIAPSRREGLGLPILEAMSCGLPVITTDAPPMNEWFSDNTLLIPIQTQQQLSYGDIPMYTPNPFELMQRMLYAIEHPKHVQRLGAINRKNVEEKFSWKVLKDTYLQLFSQVMESKVSYASKLI